jgi:hypothetical protein
MCGHKTDRAEKQYVFSSTSRYACTRKYTPNNRAVRSHYLLDPMSTFSANRRKQREGSFVNDCISHPFYATDGSKTKTLLISVLMLYHSSIQSSTACTYISSQL